MPNNITIVAGHIKEIPANKEVKKGLIDTVIYKQEMFGAGDVKANQTMLEELKAVNEAQSEQG